MANTTINNDTVIVPATAAEDSDAALRAYGAFTGTITAFSLMSLVVSVLGMGCTHRRYVTGNHKYAMAAQVGDQDQKSVTKLFLRRQFSAMVGLIIKATLSIVLLVLQFDRVGSTGPAWTTTAQRESFGHLCLALICATSGRLWAYEPDSGTQISSPCCYRLSFYMTRITPAVSVLAVAWDSFDLIAEKVIGQQCIDLCTFWLLWTFNFLAMACTLGAWLYIAEQKFWAYRNAPIACHADAQLHLLSDCATTSLAFINALMTLLAYAIMVGFSWMPERLPKAHPVQDVQLTDAAWYIFVIFFLVYMCLDTAVLLIGQLDQIPVALAGTDTPEHQIDAQPAELLARTLAKLSSSTAVVASTSNPFSIESQPDSAVDL